MELPARLLKRGFHSRATMCPPRARRGCQQPHCNQGSRARKVYHHVTVRFTGKTIPQALTDSWASDI